MQDPIFYIRAIRVAIALASVIVILSYIVEPRHRPFRNCLVCAKCGAIIPAAVRQQSIIPSSQPAFESLISVPKKCPRCGEAHLELYNGYRMAVSVVRRVSWWFRSYPLLMHVLLFILLVPEWARLGYLVAFFHVVFLGFEVAFNERLYSRLYALRQRLMRLCERSTKKGDENRIEAFPVALIVAYIQEQAGTTCTIENCVAFFDRMGLARSRWECQRLLETLEGLCIIAKDRHQKNARVVKEHDMEEVRRQLSRKRYLVPKEPAMRINHYTDKASAHVADFDKEALRTQRSEDESDAIEANMAEEEPLI